MNSKQPQLNNVISENDDLQYIKRFICDTCFTFEKKECIDVLNFIYREHVSINFFNVVSDGIKINLDIIENEDIIKRVYNFVLYKMNKSNI